MASVGGLDRRVDERLRQVLAATSGRSFASKGLRLSLLRASRRGRPPVVDDVRRARAPRRPVARAPPRPRRCRAASRDAASSKQLRRVRCRRSPRGRPGSAPRWCRGSRRRSGSSRPGARTRWGRIPSILRRLRGGGDHVHHERGPCPAVPAARPRCDGRPPSSPQASIAARIRPRSPRRRASQRVDAAEDAAEAPVRDRTGDLPLLSPASRNCARETTPCWRSASLSEPSVAIGVPFGPHAA